MMRADASLHANQARLQVSEPRFDLAARPLLPRHDAAAPILADEVERNRRNRDRYRVSGTWRAPLSWVSRPACFASRVGAPILARRDGTSSCRDQSRLRQFRYYSGF